MLRKNGDLRKEIKYVHVKKKISLLNFINLEVDVFFPRIQKVLSLPPLFLQDATHHVR